MYNDNHFDYGTTVALRSWLLTSDPTPFCFCKPCSRRACLEIDNTDKPCRRHTCRIPNSDIRRAGRGEAAHGRAAGRGRARQGGAGQRRFGAPRRKIFISPSKTPKTTTLNVSSEERTKEIPCKPNLSNPKPGHTTGRAGRGPGGARPVGAAGSDGAGRWSGTAALRCALDTSVHFALLTTVLDVSSEAQTNEIACNRMGEHDDRLKGSSSAGRRALFAPGC